MERMCVCYIYLLDNTVYKSMKRYTHDNAHAYTHTYVYRKDTGKKYFTTIFDCMHTS